MRLYIVRHGVTTWNALKKVQGSADIPLAEEGIRLARLTGEALKEVPFDLCYTSPLGRARRTAELILAPQPSAVPVIEDARIQEIDFGVLEGTRFKDENGRVISREMDIFFNDPLNFKRPGNGENIGDICKRTRDFWEEITARKDLQDKNILITSHGCAVRALLQNVYQNPKDFWHGKVPPNCSVNLIEVISGQVRVLEEDKVYAK